MTRPRLVPLPEHIVEIVSDAGEGAQKAAIAFAQLCAKAGNGLWTVEIIPSEIRPPPHTVGSASGNRIRLAERSRVTNAGNLADVVLAFNEMALLSRLEAGSLADDVLVLIDNQWATHDNEDYQRSYREVLDTFRARGATIIEIPLQEETLRHVEDAEQGKNMFAVGLLCALYNKDLNLLQNVIRGIFEKKPDRGPESRDEREHRTRARRRLGRIRDVFHVSDHAGDLRVTRIVGDLRRFRWLRPSGRRRDRRNRGGARGLLRRKNRPDHHLGAGHGLEDRVPGLGRDDRDTARHR
jgi:Pyruvate/2-oxoacid:ferredoxin oxidoreductase gamma subunit